MISSQSLAAAVAPPPEELDSAEALDGVNETDPESLFHFSTMSWLDRVYHHRDQ